MNNEALISSLSVIDGYLNCALVFCVKDEAKPEVTEKYIEMAQNAIRHLQETLDKD